MAYFANNLLTAMAVLLQLQGGAEVVRKGQVKPVSIADEKRSGRDVTKVSRGGAVPLPLLPPLLLLLSLLLLRLAVEAFGPRAAHNRALALLPTLRAAALCRPSQVAHLESFALSADEMAGVFQRKFQCSAT